jgi:hypothetical protein
MVEELSEILQNSSNEKYLQDDGKVDNEENNVEIKENIDHEIEESALQREKDSLKEEVALAQRTTNQIM